MGERIRAQGKEPTDGPGHRGQEGDRVRLQPGARQGLRAGARPRRRRSGRQRPRPGRAERDGPRSFVALRYTQGGRSTESPIRWVPSAFQTSPLALSARRARPSSRRSSARRHHLWQAGQRHRATDRRHGSNAQHIPKDRPHRTVKFEATPRPYDHTVDDIAGVVPLVYSHVGRLVADKVTSADTNISVTQYLLKV